MLSNQIHPSGRRVFGILMPASATAGDVFLLPPDLCVWRWRAEKETSITGAGGRDIAGRPYDPYAGSSQCVNAVEHGSTGRIRALNVALCRRRHAGYFHHR